MEADPFEVQYLGPDPGDNLLQWRARLHEWFGLL